MEGVMEADVEEILQRLSLHEHLLENLFAAGILEADDPLQAVKQVAESYSGSMESAYPNRPVGVEELDGMRADAEKLTARFFLKVEKRVAQELDRQKGNG